MIRGLSIGINKLNFPGTRPGVDFSHPASGSGGALPVIRFSAVAAPGTNNMINLPSAQAATTITGTPSAQMLDVIGPAVFFGNGATDKLTFPNLNNASVAASSTLTMGAIVQFSAITTTQNLLYNASVNFAFQVTTTTIELYQSGAVSFTATLAAGVPYFIAMSGSTAVNGSCVVRNLLTGKIVTATSTGHITSIAWTGAPQVGNNSSNNGVGDCAIAAVMMSNAFLTVPQLIAWANDPWAFWYPDKTFAVSQVFMSRGATSVATTNFGWFSRNQDDRILPVSRLPDQATPFFRPSQVPVPTGFYPPTTGEEDRPPAIKRPPDEPGAFFRSLASFPKIWLPTAGEAEHPVPIKRPPGEPLPWFVRSPVPVPQSWQPTAGEQDHPPVIKRPPDEPTGYFFLPTSTRTTPSTWLPTTGEEDRPPTPNRVPAPDQPFPWFVRSPVPVPTSWLPTAGQEDRPPPFRPDLTQQSFAPIPPAPTVGIAGMAWWRQTEVYLEPAASYRDYKPAWDPQFIVQIAPTFHEIYNNEFLSPVGATGPIKRNP